MTELGQSLKTERMDRGLTLQDLFERTRISVGVLKSLEDGDYERIGTSLLVRSFIRIYCSALGIDPEPILEDHAAEIDACDRQEKGIRDYRRLTLSFVQRKRKWLIVTVVLAMVIVGSIVAGAWFVQTREKLFMSQFMTKKIIPQEELPSDLPRATGNTETAQESAEPSKPPEQSAANVPGKEGLPHMSEIKEQSIAPADPQTTAGSSSAPAPEETKAEAPAGVQASHETLPKERTVPNGATGETPSRVEGHVLSAEASQNVWVEVRVDDKVIYNAVMKEGEKREWNVGENVQVAVGNAGGIGFKWDGKPLKPLGKHGRVVRLRLPDPAYLDQL